ncbi:MAG: CHRD domain-containing protein [Vicinamibacterales bacterium]
MKKVLFAAMLVALSASAAQAVPITYKTVLNGTNENPDVLTAGTGTATVIYDSVTHLLSLNVAFSGLTGDTTASHIHCCQADPLLNAGVATTTPTFAGFPLGVKSGTYANVLDLTLASSWNPAFVTAQGGIGGAEAALAAGLNAGASYLNIHSSFAGGGEIRGQLTAVPEPASMALLGLGMAAVASRKRRA